MSNEGEGSEWWSQAEVRNVPLGEKSRFASSPIKAEAEHGTESDIPLYIGIGAYLVSLLLGTWMTSWGFSLSGFEALQTSVDLFLDWPGMFSSTVAFNQELSGLSFGTSLVLTLNWFLWDCLPLMLFVFMSLRIYQKEYGGVGGRAFLYYLVLLFITDILSISFVNSMGDVISYPFDILEWRSWEILAILSISVSYFGRDILGSIRSRKLDEFR